MYKICFFVPESHVEKVKAALFEKGAGHMGNYDFCAWQTKGESQFRTLNGSQPFIGRPGITEKVIEYKVEMVCDDHIIKDVVQTLRKEHPYEEPYFEVSLLLDDLAQIYKR